MELKCISFAFCSSVNNKSNFYFYNQLIGVALLCQGDRPTCPLSWYNIACSDYLRYIGAWETHKVDSQGHEILPSQGVEVLLNFSLNIWKKNFVGTSKLKVLSWFQQKFIKKYHNESGWYQTVITNKWVGKTTNNYSISCLACACMTKPWIIQISNFQCIQMWSGRRG